MKTRNIINIILICITIVLTIKTLSFAGENTKIIGNWRKSYIEQNENRNYDPRWELIISFLDNNEFIWESTLNQEEWLINSKTGEKQTEVITSKLKLEGKYIFKKDKYHITFNRMLTNEEKQIATINLGYNDKSKECLLEIYFEKELLVLKGLHAERIIFFEKYNKNL